MKKLAFLTMLVLSAQLIAAGTGTTLDPWLKLPESAVSAGLTDAMTSLQGLEALAYNPAGICGLSTMQASYTHTEGLFSTRYENLDFVHPDFGFGTFGLQLRSLWNNSIVGRDDSGNVTGNLNYYSVAYGLAWARETGVPGTAFGAQVKGLYNQYGTSDFQDGLAALDLGLRSELRLGPVPPKTLFAGIAVQNLGLSLNYRAGQFTTPTSLRFGLSWQPEGQGLLTAADVCYPLDSQQIIPQAGIQYTFFKLLTARAGYRFDQDNIDAVSGMGLGFGIKLAPWSIDYAWSPSGGMGNTHRISLTADLGQGFLGKSEAAQTTPATQTQDKPKEDPDAPKTAPKGGK